MLPVMADFSSASSLLTLGTPLAGASGISGSGTSGGISFKSLLNEGDSVMPLPEVAAEPAGSFLPETAEPAASQLAADLKPLNGNEVNQADKANKENGAPASGEVSSGEGDFYDLAADNDDLSQKLYSEELTSADYELYDPLSRAGEELSAGDLLRYVALPDSGNRDFTAVLSGTALNPELISVINPENTAPAWESAISAAADPVLMPSDNDDSARAASAAEKTSFAGHYSQESAEDSTENTEAAPGMRSGSAVTAKDPGQIPELPEDMPFTLAAAFAVPDGNAAGTLTSAASAILIQDTASEVQNYRAMPDDMPVDEASAVSGESVTVTSEARGAEHSAVKTDEKTEENAPDYRALSRIAAGNAAEHAVRNDADRVSSDPEMVYVPAEDKISAGVSVEESAAQENAAGMTAAKPETQVSADGIYGKEQVQGISPEIQLARPSELSASVSQAAISDADPDDARTIPENARHIPEDARENAAISPERREPADPVIANHRRESVIAAAPEIPASSPETPESAAFSPENRTFAAEIMAGSLPEAGTQAPAEPVLQIIPDSLQETSEAALASPENRVPAFEIPENGPDAAAPAPAPLKTADFANSPVSDMTDSRSAEAPASAGSAASEDFRFSADRASIPGALPEDTTNRAPESAARPYISERGQHAGREDLSGQSAAKMPDNARSISENVQDLRSLSKITGLESIAVREAPAPVIRTSGLGLEISGVRENGSALDALNLLMAQKNVSTGVVSSAPVFFREPEALAALPDSGFQEDAGGEILSDGSALISAGTETGGEDAGDSGSFGQEQRSSGSHEGLIPGREQRGSDGASAAGTGSFSSIFGKGLFGTGGTQEADSSALTGAVRLFEGQPRENAERLRDQVLRMAARNLRKVEIALTPERLGHLKIEVEMGDSGRARVHFAVQNSEAREILSQSMDRLRDSLSQAGISLEGHTVAQDGGGESRGRERAEREWENSLRRLARSGRHAEWQDSLKGAFDSLSEASGIRKFW